MNIKNLFNKLIVRFSNKQLRPIGVYTTRYNCIAYALGFNTLNIWPIEFPPTMRNLDQTLVFWPSDLKYDEYQQYKPGSRFVENLCAWLNQFDKGTERNIAFNFLLKNLVFISISEMHRLIETAYYECILPLFKDDAAVLCQEAGMEGCEQRITELFKTKALFLAMSDGARIDVLRRIARLDHEQVFVTYDLPEQKFTKIISEANKRVTEKETDAEVINKLPRSFGHIFLLDDFSGSGISYL